MPLRVEDQLPRLGLLSHEVGNTMVPPQVIPPKKNEDFFSPVFPKMAGYFRGRDFLAEQCRFVGRPDPGVTEPPAGESLGKPLEVSRGRLEAASAVVRNRVHRGAQ